MILYLKTILILTIVQLSVGQNLDACVLNPGQSEPICCGLPRNNLTLCYEGPNRSIKFWDNLVWETGYYLFEAPLDTWGELWPRLGPWTKERYPVMAEYIFDQNLPFTLTGNHCLLGVSSMAPGTKYAWFFADNPAKQVIPPYGLYYIDGSLNIYCTNFTNN